MATNKPISAFDAIDPSDIQPDDEFIGVDVSDPSSSSSGTTKRFALQDILNNPNNGEIAGEFIPAVSSAAVAGGIVQTSQNGMTFKSQGGTLTDFNFLSSAGLFLAAMRSSDGALLGGKLMGVSAAPTIVVASGAGTGATVSLVGSNTCGIITLTTGTGVTPRGQMFTLTFSVPYANGVVTQINYALPASGSSNAFPPVAPLSTTTTVILETLTSTALDDTTPYTFSYQVLSYDN